MKIAYICVKNLNSAAGVENYTKEVAKRLGKDYEATIYTTSDEIPYVGENIKVVRVSSIKGGIFEKITGGLFGTIAAISSGADILHYQAFGASLFAPIARMFGKRVIVHGHGIEWKRAKWNAAVVRILKLIEWISVRSAHRVLVVSKVQSQQIYKDYNINTLVIPGGVTLLNSDEKSILKKYQLENGHYILFVGRLTKEKGAHVLIKAFKGCDFKEIKLVIAGPKDLSSKYYNELISLAENEPSIIFTGFISQVYLSTLYKNAALYVSPSTLEGMSLTVLDSIGYGTPTLVSNIPENLEAINNCDFGESFTSGQIFSLERKIKQCLSEDSNIREKSSIGSAYVSEKLTWNVCAQRHQDVYNDMIGNV